MKKIFLSVIIGVVMLSCNKANESVSPTNNQKVLGLVVQVASASSDGLILLKDGRALNPQSGFNPTQVRVGNKFVLSFEKLSTSGKVLNVKVTNFTLANDSTFVPKPVNSDSIAFDSLAFKTAMQGSHHCTFTSSVVDYSHPADTMKITKEFTIEVNGNTFQSSATYAPVPGGTGIYYFKHNQVNSLYFLNYANLPNSAGLPPGFLLNGYYYYAVFDKYVAIWTYTNTTYSGFLISR